MSPDTPVSGDINVCSAGIVLAFNARREGMT